MPLRLRMARTPQVADRSILVDEPAHATSVDSRGPLYTLCLSIASLRPRHVCDGLMLWRGSIKKQSEHRRTPREQVVSSLVEQLNEALAIKTARDIHPSLHQETLDLGGPHAWMSRADRICLRCATGA